MKWAERASAIMELVNRLHEHGSWVGETHLQKAVYFLMEATEGEGLDYSFVLYKHGPFSFELRDDLSVFRSRQLLDLKIQSAPYGPRIVVTSSGDALRQKHQDAVEQLMKPILRVAEFVGPRGVVELERLSTALFVHREDPGRGVAERAARIVTLKPHIGDEEAREAVEELDVFLGAA